MSLNDTSLNVARGVDVHPGVANPTASSNNADPLHANFVSDPTIEARGAGAGPDFQGDKLATQGFKQTAGVVEGRPGVIETANIDPLNENSNKDDGWANATVQPGSGTQSDKTYTAAATEVATSAANQASAAATAASQTAAQTYGAAKEAMFGAK